MLNFSKLSPWFAGAVLLAAIVGCSSKPAAPKSAAPANNQAGTTESEEEGIAKVLASMSPEDRELVIKQKVCPVSGERLGTPAMGAPPKVDVKGHAVFICCPNCRDELLNEPDKYLAKLGLATDAPATK